MPLDDEQRRFAAALADPALSPPAGSQQRFGVHRNNVRAGIAAVLEARFPAVKRLVGGDFFTAMAAAYAQSEPPASPILLLYGGGFPAFVDGFEPASDLRYLGDVARLEWLLHEATNAADAASIGSDELAAVPPAEVAELRLRLHPSLRLFSSRHPALTIWKMNAAPGEIATRRLAADAEQALLLRPTLDVEVRRIDEPFHAFCAQLQQGSALTAAFEAAVSRSDHFDLQHSLAGLISMGAIVGYVRPADIQQGLDATTRD